MKKLFYLSFLLITIVSYSQPTGYLGQRLYGPTMTNQWFVYNSPGTTFANSRLVYEFKDSTYARWSYNSFRIDYLGSASNVYLKSDASGNLQKGLITDIFNPSDYYNKTDSDARYLQNFTELDPIYLSSTWFSTTNNSTNWNTTFGWGNHATVGYFLASNFNSSFDTRLGTKTTSNLSEGSNLYYTDVRVQTFGDGRYVRSIGLSSSTLTLGGNNPTTSTGTISVNLPNVGTSGTYGIVNTDSQGRVTSGKKQETYSGTTSGSGAYTVTFSSAYSVAPNIQQACTNCTDTQRSRVTSITTTGFTIQGRTETLGLIFNNANGLNVDVLITEK